MKRAAWTIMMGILPFAIFAFAKWDLDVATWDGAMRFFAAAIGAVAAIATWTYPGWDQGDAA